VKTKQILDKFGLEEPGQGDEILGQATAKRPNAANPTDPASLNSILYRAGSKIKRGQAAKRVSTALAAQGPSAGEFEPQDVSKVLADRLQGEAAPAILSMLETVEAMLQAATSLPEFTDMLLTAYPDLDDADLVDVMASALTAAHAGGRAALEQESG